MVENTYNIYWDVIALNFARSGYFYCKLLKSIKVNLLLEGVRVISRSKRKYHYLMRLRISQRVEEAELGVTIILKYSRISFFKSK